MLRKLFLELVCVLTLVVGFAGIAQAESTATYGNDWFLTATKSAVSSSLDVLAKTGVLPLAESAEDCSIECGLTQWTKGSCSTSNCSSSKIPKCYCDDCTGLSEEAKDIASKVGYTPQCPFCVCADPDPDQPDPDQ